MSDSVTNPVGNADPRGGAAGFSNSKVPLSDLFANVLNKTAFSERMLSHSEFGLARAVERAFEARPDVDEANQDYAEAAPSDDGPPEVSESEDQSDESDEAQAETQTDDQQQDDGSSASQQAGAETTDEHVLAIGAAANDKEKPGLTVQPNTASGVQLREMTEGPTPGQARVISNNGEAQSAANIAANTNNGRGSAADAAMPGNSAFGKAQAGAGTQQPDATAAKPELANAAAAAKQELNTDAAAAKLGTNLDSAAADKPQVKDGPVLPQAQTQAAMEGNAEDLWASLERHALLIRAGAKRAAELFQMKVRLAAHQKAIKNAITQSSAGSDGAQSQNAVSSTSKPSVEILTNVTPPAPAASGAPAVRPAALFNSPVPGSLPGQAGNGSTPLAIGEVVGNGAEQSATAADRQAAAANTSRTPAFRPLPPQMAYQPAEQVKVHIQQLVKSGADRIQIKLSPASLGRVEVALEMTPDKTVQAIVYAEKPETLDMLERDARVLQKAFEEAGMKFDSDGLTFKHGQSGDPETELADSAGQSDDAMSEDGDGFEGGDGAETDQPRRRQHDGMLDLEI